MLPSCCALERSIRLSLTPTESTQSCSRDRNYSSTSPPEERKHASFLRTGQLLHPLMTVTPPLIWPCLCQPSAPLSTLCYLMTPWEGTSHTPTMAQTGVTDRHSARVAQPRPVPSSLSVQKPLRVCNH